MNTARKTLYGSSAAGAFGIAMLALSSQAVAQSSDELYEAARAEGGFVFYASNHPELTARLVDAFQEQYEGIEVEVVRLASGALGRRYAAEAEAGNVTADLLQLADPLLIRDVAEAGYIVPLADEIATYDDWPEDFKGEHYIVGALSVMTLSYNTDLVPAESVPTSWEDLLNPEFQGEILMADIRQSPATLDWLVLMEETYGTEFVEGLAAQDVEFVASTVPGTQMMAAGEKAILAPNQRQVTFPVIALGGPIADVVLEPSVVHESMVAISRDASSPNAARLFLEFMMTPEGQEALNTGVNSSPLPGVPGAPELPGSFRRSDLENSISERDRLSAIFGLN